MLACVVGTIGGIYGIGGGAIIAPFCVAVFKLPVYTISGAALLGTFITSIIGVIFYAFISLGGTNYPPDWSLGILLGLGGLLGMYMGARMQKFVPENLIKSILCFVLISIAFLYIRQFFS